jgi:lycopene cyclase domain-containing protein
MPEYGLILVGLLVVTVVLHRSLRLRLYKSTKQFVLFVGFSLIAGTILDTLAILRGYWSFNPQFLVGWRVGVMPIEEIGFMLVMWYFLLVIYKILEKYGAK